MSIDDILGKMNDAMEADDFWNSEVYAQQALDYINNGGELNKNAGPEDIEELKGHLSSIVETAKSLQEKQKKDEAFKRDLIEQIVNHKG
jgi:hypothetical protein